MASSLFFDREFKFFLFIFGGIFFWHQAPVSGLEFFFLFHTFLRKLYLVYRENIKTRPFARLYQSLAVGQGQQ